MSSITPDQIALHMDDIPTPLAASVTDNLPLLPILRKLIANVMAQELV